MIIDSNGIWWLHRAKIAEMSLISYFGITFFGPTITPTALKKDGQTIWKNQDELRTCMQFVSPAIVASKDMEQQQLLKEDKSTARKKLHDPTVQEKAEKAGVIIDELGTWHIHKANINKLLLAEYF